MALPRCFRLYDNFLFPQDDIQKIHIYMFLHPLIVYETKN